MARELILQIELEIKANETNEATVHALCSYEKCKQATFQWPPECGWEEDEDPFSVLSAWVSCEGTTRQDMQRSSKDEEREVLR